MKMPKDCPFCKGPLLNDYSHNGSLRKICNKHIEHNIHYFSDTVYDSFDKVIMLWISIDLETEIWWQPDTFACWLQEKEGRWAPISLPYFEPDLTDYKELMRKIRLVLTFR